jgi:hypothetical protein
MAVPEVRKPCPYGKLDWEGTGVEADMKINAANALTKAEELATKLRNR